MEHLHVKAVEAIQPFVLMAKSQASHSPRYLTTLIMNATSAPHTYVFGELLDLPAVQNLKSLEDFRPYVTLLEIFTCGTWRDYKFTPGLPELNPEQTKKLRLLTLLTLAKKHNPLTYSTVLASLSLSSTAELESLVTDAIYSSIITARFSPTTTPPVIRVTSVAPLRNPRVTAIDPMISVLQQWESRCRNAIGGIEVEIAKIRAQAEKRRTRQQDRTSRLERSMNGWEGNRAGPATGALGGAGLKRPFHRPWESSYIPWDVYRRRDGRKFGLGTGSKREYNAMKDLESRYGHSGRMGRHPHLDEGYDGDDSGRLARNAKRMLGLSHRP